MAYDEGLAERIRLAVTDRRAVAEKKMFGGMAFMLNDYMFCGVTNEELMARVGPDNYEALPFEAPCARDGFHRPLDEGLCLCGARRR